MGAGQSGELPYTGLVILEQDLRPVLINDAARELFRQLSGPSSTADELPEEIYRRCLRLKSALDTGQGHEALQRFNLTASDGRTLASVYVRLLGCGSAGVRFMVCLNSGDSGVVRSARMKDFGLTRREVDIVHLVGVGMTNPEIADKLCISVRTVQNHLRSIYEKAGVHNRTSLVYRLASSA